MLVVIASQQVLQVTAALHCSPWESIIPDPRYQIKINLYQKSHFALLFTLEPFSVQMTPPAAGDLLWFPIQKAANAMRNASHKIVPFTWRNMFVNTCSMQILFQFFQAWSHLIVDSLSLRPQPYLWQVLHSSNSYLTFFPRNSRAQAGIPIVMSLLYSLIFYMVPCIEIFPPVIFKPLNCHYSD